MGSLPRSVSENLHFLCAELDGQLTSLEAYFDDPQPARAQKVILRAGYSYNLWSRVQRGCQDAIKGKKTRRDTQLLMHNCALVAQNLDLIARMARRCLQHAEEVTRPELLRPAAYPKTIKILRKQIKDIIPAIEARDSERAVKMGQVKTDLDALYDQLFRTLTRDMRKL